MQQQKKAVSKQAAQKRNTSRRRKKRSHHSFFPYVILIFLVLVVGIVLSFRMFLKIDHIEVKGESPYSAEEIIETSGLENGMNLYSFKIKEVEQKLLSRFGYIESVSIKRKLPTRVQISITPAKELGVMELKSGYAVISEKGKVLQTLLSLPSENVLLIHGTELESPQVNSYLDVENNEKLQMLMALVQSVKKNEFPDITEIDLSDRFNMSFIYQDRVKVILGSESNLDYKVRLAKTVILEQQQPGFEGTLDVSMGKKAVEKAGKISKREQVDESEEEMEQEEAAL